MYKLNAKALALMKAYDDGTLEDENAVTLVEAINNLTDVISKLREDYRCLSDSHSGLAVERVRQEQDYSELISEMVLTKADVHTLKNKIEELEKDKAALEFQVLNLRSKNTDLNDQLLIQEIEEEENEDL